VIALTVEYGGSHRFGKGLEDIAQGQDHDHR
jgi:hypothetical protein